MSSTLPRLAAPAIATADEVVAHTLLNCLLREMSGPERHTAVSEGHLHLRMPRSGVLLRVRLRRTSLIGAHRFAGSVAERRRSTWAELSWRGLAARVDRELRLRTGVANDEFIEQIKLSHAGVTAALRYSTAYPGGRPAEPGISPGSGPAAGPQRPAAAAAGSPTPGPLAPSLPGPAAAPPATCPARGATGAPEPGPSADQPPGPASASDPHDPAAGPAPGSDPYLASEQSLIFGHRFHPTPKARSGSADGWRRYAPEAGARFPLHQLAVRADRIRQESVSATALAALDRQRPVPDGYLALPAHPWQYAMLREHPALRAAIARGDVCDLGPGGRWFTPTASVRTLYDGRVFLKFSLNVRITNCLRKNAEYELAGAVALTQLLEPVVRDLSTRFPGCEVLREPAYRTLALRTGDASADRELAEGFGVIVREGLAARLAPGVTGLLAAAVADEYPTGGAQIGRLLAAHPAGAGPDTALAWWDAYLRLLVPPVLAAYFDHGVVLEPHLQNVVVGVDGDNWPRQVLFRDLEGTKLLAGRHRSSLAALPADVAGPMTYDSRRGWDRVVYCLLVNHVAELLAALADLYPELEPALWSAVRRVLHERSAAHGEPPPLRALATGAPLPAKANLLTRWGRKADRDAGYVRIGSPLGSALLSEAAREAATTAPWSSP
ncbi:IucA/IucC family protein [Streptomyces zagrosensis]|uniref:Siderophore synthetase component n=1 Tax=Streptomyces zagrosensis TaxID=1042984 RepID=A0A7W9QBR3_9ACTN|nr:IucA/IucC family protein [Streptomyces zagrosensis]MBB5936297.1 siderophore synthetase component [Streptomyces zagrosensis]